MANIERSTYHATIVLSRQVKVPADRVFAMLSDPAERCRLTSSRGTVRMALDQAHFGVGERCEFRFGRKGDLRFQGTMTVHEIVPDRRIVSTDIVALASKPLSIATAVFEIRTKDAVTEIKLTAQIAWLDSGETIDGAEMPYAEFLDAIMTASSPPTVPLRRLNLRR